MREISFRRYISWMHNRLRSPTTSEIARDWTEFSGGPPLLGALGAYEPPDVEGVLFEDAETARRGMITWAVKDDVAELVSVHADPPGGGLGSELIAHVEQVLRERGARRLLVATTNDNLGALRFYIRHGFRLIEVRLDFMDRVREVKPGVPPTGNDGIPLRDLWVLEKVL